MDKVYNLVIAGLGGQGILFIAKTLCKAAMNKGYEVVMNEVHGLAQRGGTVVTNVRIGPVYSPMVSDADADVIVALELNEALRVVDKASDNCTALVSSVPIYPLTSSLGYDIYPSKNEVEKQIKDNYSNIIFIDPEKIAKECGYLQVANVAMLGALTALNLLPVDKEDILKAIKDSVGMWMWKVDKKAFNKGYDLVKSQMKEVK